MIQSNPYFQSLPVMDPRLQGAALALLCLGVVIAVSRSFRRSTAWRRNRRPWLARSAKPVAAAPSAAPLPPIMPFDQMRAIAAVEFEVWPLLNKEEARLLPLLEAAVREFGSGHRLMAQTSLGEIIRPKGTAAHTAAQSAAYAAINSKRLDFAVFDRFGRMVAAIEYQGSGHYQNNAFLRDAVKREAVRKAGVPYIEIDHSALAPEITARLRPILMSGNAG